MIAKVNFNNVMKRYELTIEGKLKAYSSGNNTDEHIVGLNRMVELAEQKGYTVHVDKRVH
jgi:hypothetical protein